MLVHSLLYFLYFSWLPGKACDCFIKIEKFGRFHVNDTLASDHARVNCQFASSRIFLQDIVLKNRSKNGVKIKLNAKTTGVVLGTPGLAKIAVLRRNLLSLAIIFVCERTVFLLFYL